MRTCPLAQETTLFSLVTSFLGRRSKEERKSKEADSLFCMVETNARLLSNYTPIKVNQKKRNPIPYSVGYRVLRCILLLISLMYKGYVNYYNQIRGITENNKHVFIHLTYKMCHTTGVENSCILVFYHIDILYPLLELVSIIFQNVFIFQVIQSQPLVCCLPFKFYIKIVSYYTYSLQ